MATVSCITWPCTHLVLIKMVLYFNQPTGDEHFPASLHIYMILNGSRVFFHMNESYLFTPYKIPDVFTMINFVQMIFLKMNP